MIKKSETGQIIGRATELIKEGNNQVADVEMMLRELPSGDRQTVRDLLLQHYRFNGVVKLLLKPLLRKSPASFTRRLLHLSCTMLLFQRGTPPFAIVDGAVNYIKKRKGKAAAGFTNAVRRAFCERYKDILEINERELVAEALETLLAERYLPAFFGPGLYQKWHARFSTEYLKEMARILCTPPDVTVRWRSSEQPPASLSLLPRLDWAENALLYRCDNPREFFADPPPPENWYVQDPATLLAPSMFGDLVPDGVYGDFCAAPGGKSLMLADRLSRGAKLIACDSNPGRLKRLKENLAGTAGVEVMLNDALKPVFEPGTFDGVLLDVPCSNTGVIRKKPDVKWRIDFRHISELNNLQLGILSATLPLIKDGGTIVYSTCSIEDEENHTIVKRFVAQHPEATLVNELRLLPCKQHDGAYAARISVN